MINEKKINGSDLFKKIIELIKTPEGNFLVDSQQQSYLINNLSSIGITDSKFTKEKFGKYLSVKHRNYLSDRSFGIVNQGYDYKIFTYAMFPKEIVNFKGLRKKNNRHRVINAIVWGVAEFSYKGERHFLIINIEKSRLYIIKSHLFQRFAERHQNNKMYKNHSVMSLVHYLNMYEESISDKNGYKMYIAPGILLGEEIGTWEPSVVNSKGEEIEGRYQSSSIYYLRTFISRDTLNGEKLKEYEKFINNNISLEDYDKKYSKVSWLYVDNLMKICKELSI